MKREKWRKYLPSTRLFIEIPFFRAQIVVVQEADDMWIFEVFRLDLQIWKWKFNFNLYYK